MVPEVLAAEDLDQVPPRLRIVALDEAEALGRTVGRNTLAHNGHEMGLFVLPVPQVAAIETDGDWHWRCGQAGALIWTAGQSKGWFGAEFRLQTAGHPVDIATNGHRVQGRINGEELT